VSAVEPQPQELSPLDNGLRMLRDRWWVLVVATLVVTGLLVARSVSSPKQYEATSVLLIRPSSLITLIDPNGRQGDDPLRDAATNLLLVKSGDVARLVRLELRTTRSADELLGHVDVTNEPNTDLLSVTATDRDPEQAAAIANAFADQFVVFRRASDRRLAEQGAATLSRQLEVLAPGTSAERTELEQALQKVRALQVVTTGDVEVAGHADVPAVAAAPLPKRAAVEGVVLGFGLGVLIVLMLDLFDRRAKRVEEFEGLYRTRALAAVPQRTRAPTTPQERQRALEPFRILRNGLDLLGDDVRMMLVTSAVPGEGKSTVAAGLARAIALSGHSVVLVEVDLRRPTFHEQFDLGDDGRGLTTALVGGMPVRSLLRAVLPGLPTLRVLPSGPTPPNAAELLRSAELRRVLAELREEAEVVILDAPPLLPVADAHTLLDLPEIDACVIVARAYTSRRDEVRRARAVLDRHRAVPIGLVVNGIQGADAAYEYYGPDTRRRETV